MVMEYYINKISSKRNTVIDELSANDFKSMFEYLADNDDILEGDNFIIKLLPYYYVTHVRLGSFSHMATTHMQKLTNEGIYSVYGQKWYNGDTSQGRIVHDQVIVQ
jgi:hypothetical protein